MKSDSTIENAGLPAQAASKTGLSYLLAYDGSEHARAAVQLLLDLPETGGFMPSRCSLTLISVLPTQSIAGHEQLQQALSDEESRLKQAGFEVQTILKAGNPAASINDHAQEAQVDMILVGARGRRSALGILLGGVAQQVVEYSTRPVLVVRAPYQGLKRILVVVDGSESSLSAVNYLVPICPDGSRKRCTWLPRQAQYKMMHVLPPPISTEATMRAWALGPEALYPTPIAPIDKTALEETERRFGENLLAETAKVLDLGGIKAETVLLRGDAASEILKILQSHDIDLVVCGSRGLSAVSGWLLGSVSRKLVHYSTTSVLIVK